MNVAIFSSFYFAHRGLHDVSKGIVENSASAIQRAIDAGFGIEIDIQSSADHCPMVFHDYSLNRLTKQDGLIGQKNSSELKNIAYASGHDCISPLSGILSLIDGQVPLLIEVKSNWTGEMSVEREICNLLENYQGICGVMSFDPQIIKRLMDFKCSHPLGLVTSSFDEDEWKELSSNRLKTLRDFSEAQKLDLSFFAHDVRDLGNPKLHAMLDTHDAELLSWTIRTPFEFDKAKDHNAAPIFEGSEILPFISQQLRDE